MNLHWVVNLYVDIFHSTGPTPTPAKGTSAALIVKDKEDLIADRWDARFSSFTGSTVTIQVRQ